MFHYLPLENNGYFPSKGTCNCLSQISRSERPTKKRKKQNTEDLTGLDRKHTQPNGVPEKGIPLLKFKTRKTSGDIIREEHDRKKKFKLLHDPGNEKMKK
jgi:hypothetical protein